MQTIYAKEPKHHYGAIFAFFNMMESNIAYVMKVNFLAVTERFEF